MQQVMNMMQGLQEAMEASNVEQERMQADLAASQARGKGRGQSSRKRSRRRESLWQIIGWMSSISARRGESRGVIGL